MMEAVTAPTSKWRPMQPHRSRPSETLRPKEDLTTFRDCEEEGKLTLNRMIKQETRADPEREVAVNIIV